MDDFSHFWPSVHRRNRKCNKLFQIDCLKLPLKFIKPLIGLKTSIKYRTLETDFEFHFEILKSITTLLRFSVVKKRSCHFWNSLSGK